MNKDRLMKILERNEYWYWFGPSVGSVQDSFLIYWELHDALLEELGEVPFETPLQERAYYDKMKRESNKNNAEGVTTEGEENR